MGQAAVVDVGKAQVGTPAEFETKLNAHLQHYRDHLQHYRDHLQHQPPLYQPPFPPYLAAHEPVELERPVNRPNALEPYQLVAAARDEYLQRRQEANQYKLRAEKQLGLRPSSADAERYRCLDERATPPQQAAQDKIQEQQEYLRQLQQIRQRYQDEMREMRQRANAEVQPSAAGAFLLEHPTDIHTHPPSEEQNLTDMEKAVRQILEQNQKERRELQKKYNDKKGVMFEINLQDDSMEGEGDKKTQEMDETNEEDPLNQTLKFDAELKFWRPAGEIEIKPEERVEEVRTEEGEKHVKRGIWRHEVPQTLLNALANMEVSSICSTYSSTQARVIDQEEEEQSSEGRRKWTDCAPDTLLNALAKAQLTYSTLGTVMPLNALEDVREKMVEDQKDDDDDEREDDSDMEVDKERLEPRSDDDDTNFEESEDELREEVKDSMRNLFIMVEAEEVQSTEEMEEDRNTETHRGTPRLSRENNEKPLNPAEGQHLETSP